MPTFFSNDPEATLAELKKKPEFGFQCLQALVSKLLARGELSRYIAITFNYVNIAQLVNAWTFTHEVSSSIPVGISVILVQRKYTCFR